MKTLIAMTCLLVMGQAHAATAFFTGRMEMVQTVTYQMAWRCEYNYAGQTFYRLFQNSCPSSVAVQ